MRGVCVQWFGTLVIPNGNDAKPTPAVESNTIRLRRSTTIKPHWTQTPRILVVEDVLGSIHFLDSSLSILHSFRDAPEFLQELA
jgi:hypothetical protein